jgi:NADPH:quinone reductase-like Zn-dependent oxidoreductase
LNFHDLAVVSGMIKTADGRIPMSDGAGEVVGVGDGVSTIKAGDYVLSAFFPERGLMGVPGDGADGFAAEYVAMSAEAFTRLPKGWSFAQAATLPCAALTAWRALMVEARIKPGDVVLTQGTGGVSIFAVQFAKAAAALKEDHRMDRNYLAHRQGDLNNAILAAAGYNFRRLIRWLRILLRLFLAMLFAPPNTLPA